MTVAAVNSRPRARPPGFRLVGRNDAGPPSTRFCRSRRPPGFRLVGRNDGCGGGRQLGSAGRTVDPAPALLDSGSGAGMTDAGAAVNSVLPVAQSTPARPPGFRLGGRNDGCGGRRQLGSAGRTVDPAPALLDSGSGAGMTDAGAAVNSVLPVAQSTRARPPGFRLGGRNDGCGGRRQLGSAGRTVDPRPPSWIPARGPE